MSQKKLRNLQDVVICEQIECIETFWHLKLETNHKPLEMRPRLLKFDYLIIYSKFNLNAKNCFAVESRLMDEWWPLLILLSAKVL